MAPHGSKRTNDVHRSVVCSWFVKFRVLMGSPAPRYDDIAGSLSNLAPLDSQIELDVDDPVPIHRCFASRVLSCVYEGVDAECEDQCVMQSRAAARQERPRPVRTSIHSGLPIN